MLARVVDADTRLGKVVRNIFPVMAPALALAADPGAALVRLERVGEAVGARQGPADALATDPGAARRLAHVVGASRFATELLVADPERLRALADDAVWADDADAALVRVVARYAARELTPRATGDAITEVADRVLADAVDHAAPTVPFAVIGMGKLGARELNFASDLDVVFVYEGEGPDDLASGVAAAGARDAARPRRRLGDRRRPPAGGTERAARAFDRRVPRVLGALRRAVGIPGAAPDPRRRRRPGARTALRAGRGRRGVPARRRHGRSRGRDAPDARADRTRTREAARGRPVPLQARSRIAGRRAVRDRAVAAPLRRRGRGAAHAADAGGDRAARRTTSGRADGRARTWGRRSCSSPT